MFLIIFQLLTPTKLTAQSYSNLTRIAAILDSERLSSLYILIQPRAPVVEEFLDFGLQYFRVDYNPWGQAIDVIGKGFLDPHVMFAIKLGASSKGKLISLW